MVLPGFIDAHAHVSAAVSLFSRRGSPASARAYCGIVADFAAAHRGRGRARTGWSAVLFEALGHARGARRNRRLAAVPSSTRTATRCGSTPGADAGRIGRARPIPGRVIERDPLTGEPSGTLRETAARLVTTACPTTRSPSTNRHHDLPERRGRPWASRPCSTRASPRGPAAQAYERLACAGRLTTTVRAALSSSGRSAGRVAARPRTRCRPHVALFRTPAVKFFADGVLEGHTAFLAQAMPTGRASRRAAVATGRACRRFRRVDAAGFQIHVHCIATAPPRSTGRTRRPRGYGRSARSPPASPICSTSPEDVPRLRGSA